jgi:DNA-binding SARP family transcriptional activator/predicted ATPase
VSTLSLYLFGPPRLEQNGSPVLVERSKAAALLAYLALSGTSFSRDSLATLLWPEYDQSRAFAYLRRTLWSLNHAVEGQRIEADREKVKLRKGENFYLDVDHFEHLCEAANEHSHTSRSTCPVCFENLKKAADLYRGDFMAGFHVRDSAGFDDWQSLQAERLRRMLESALENIAAYSLHQREYEAAVEFSRRWLSLNPLHEQAHRMLMLSYARSGNRSAALRQYQECSKILNEELGVAPQEETRNLFRKIKSGEIGPQITAIPAETLVQADREKLTPKTARPLSIPSPTTPFIGRKAQLEDILLLLRNPECRLLTLLGPGGAGKTRLSIQAALEISEEEQGFLHGIYFVPLAPLISGEGLLPSIANAISLVISGDKRADVPRNPPKEQLIDYLRQKEILLILDNYEHLIEHTDLLVSILENAPGVKLLTTTRERLNLYGEWVVEILGMELPDEGETYQDEELEHNEAVELFLKSARRVNAAFSPGDQDLRFAAEICRLVEGMPLAIELASAWMKFLPAAEIADEIRKNLDFLTSSLRNLPSRHSSLRVVFEHSWSLLNEEEKDSLKKLSVFRNSFDRQAAQEVAGASLQTISVLIDKSLLHARAGNSGGIQRFEIHQLIKQYAAEKLAEVPEEQAYVLDAYRRYFTMRIGSFLSSLRGEEQLRVIKHIDIEYEDIRTAWNLALERGHTRELADSTHALIIYLDIKGRISELVQMLEKGASHLRSLESKNSQDESIRGLYAVFLAGDIYINRWLTGEDNPDQVIEVLKILDTMDKPDPWMHAYLMLQFGAGALAPEQIFDLYQKTAQVYHLQDDAWGVAMSRMVFSNYCREHMEDKNLAYELWNKAYSGFLELGDRFNTAICLNSLADLSYEAGEYSAALQMTQESLDIYSQLGDRRRTAGALITLGHVHTAEGRYSHAIDSYQEGLAISKETGNKFLIAVLHDCLGYVNFLEQDFASAENHYQESQSLYYLLDRYQGLGMVLTNLGDIARAQDRYKEAGDLYRQAIDVFNRKSVHVQTGANRSSSLAPPEDPHQQSEWEQWGRTIATKKLGIVHMYAGDLSTAQVLLSSALKTAWGLDRPPEVLDILVSQADLLSQTGQYQPALEILGHVLGHSAAPREAGERAQKLLNEISAGLPAETVRTAVENGQRSSLDELIQSYLPVLS